MEIVETKITSMQPFQADVTSCHDAYPKYITMYTEITAIIMVRNDDVAPFEIKVKMPGTPTEKESIRFIEDLLFELG